MKATNTETAWGWVAQLLHWAMAGLILFNIGLGWYAEQLGRSPQQLKLFLLHKSVGLTVLGLVALRLAWRVPQVSPQLSPVTKAWERNAARASHALLYLLMFAIPISGWIMNSAANVPLRWFGWIEVPGLVEPNEELKEIAETVHVWLAWSLAGLVTVHFAAALHHHFRKRDDVLRRMLPLKRSTEEAQP
ncbi:MAG: cytochrome b [Xanthomonadales bacterium]|nr:cytochrome b [Xanthomonadales bacterium]